MQSRIARLSLLLLVVGSVVCCSEHGCESWQGEEVPPVEVVVVVLRRGPDAIPPPPVLTDQMVDELLLCSEEQLTGRLTLDSRGVEAVQAAEGRSLRGFVYLADAVYSFDVFVDAALVEDLPVVSFDYSIWLRADPIDQAGDGNRTATIAGLYTSFQSIDTAEYSGVYAFDGSAETPWIADTDHVETGASITVRVEDRMWIDESVFEPPEHFAAVSDRYCAVKELTVRVDSQRYSVHLPGDGTRQSLRLPGPANAKWLGFEIREVYASYDSGGAAIEEIRFLLDGKPIELDLGIYDRLRAER